MSTHRHHRLTGAQGAHGRAAAIAAGRCPYTSETIAACRFYEPASAHGSHPGAETCRFLVRDGDSHIRAARCVRAEVGVR